MIRFRCPSCSATMRASESEAGEKRRCPKCDTTFRIPKVHGDGGPTAEASRSKPKAKPKRKKQNQEELLVPVVCGVCNTRVYAKLNQVGTSIECPDCFTQNLVKQPDKSKLKPGPDISKIGDYGLSPAEEVTVISTLGAEKLEKADEFVQQKMEAEPKVPDRPFVDGIFLYPFRADIFPFLIGMGMSWSFLMLAMNWAWHLEGFLAAITPFIMALLAIVFVLVVVPSVVIFQNIMENGANGDDESEVRPDGGLFAIVEWLVEILPMIIAATVSCLPTLGVFHLISYFAGDAIPFPIGMIVELVAAFLAYLIYPVIHLSMLENNSILGMYSPQIWGSLTAKMGAWMKFWAISTLLCIVFVGVQLACHQMWGKPIDSQVIMGVNSVDVRSALHAFHLLPSSGED